MVNQTGAQGVLHFGDLQKPECYKVTKQDTTDVLVMQTNGSMTTPFYSLYAGSYSFNINANSSMAGGAYSQIRVSILQKQNPDSSIREQTFELNGKMKPYSLDFDITKPAIIAARIEFLNDYYDKETKQDRNVFIGSLSITQTPNKQGSVTSEHDLGLTSYNNRIAQSNLNVRYTTMPLEWQDNSLGISLSPTKPKCEHELELVVIEDIASEHSHIKHNMLEMSLRGTISTSPCTLTPGAYHFKWTGRGNGDIVKVQIVEYLPTGNAKIINERQVLLQNQTIDWYDLVDVKSPTEISFRLQWVNGPGYPVDKDDQRLYLSPTVALQEHTDGQLRIGEAVQRAWQDLINDLRGIFVPEVSKTSEVS